MSECDCAAETGCEESGACCRGGGMVFKVLPYLLLLAAAGLWIWDNQQKKGRIDAVRTVVEKVAVPLKAVAIGQKVEGKEAIAVVVCPPTEATELLGSIAKAEPARFPRNAEGTECEIHLIQTNDTVTVLRTVCLEKDPEALYVGVKYAGQRDESGKVVSWVYSPPVRVPDAGVQINKILDLIHNITPAVIENAEKKKNAQPQAEAVEE
ncbi:MAG: hypothetical protein FWF84_06935 [Kiritimatiellaeota bacterium]|nr:hypothetical protein [Kiritimatiellota bacterium]